MQSEKKPKRFYIKLAEFSGASFVVALLLELFVFNAASFIQLSGKYSTEALKIDSAVVTGFAQDPSSPETFVANSVRPTIEFKNIDQKVRTLYVNASSDKENRYQLQIELNYTDSTRIGYNHSPKLMQLIPGVDRTKYTACSYSGETGNLKLTFQVNPGEVLHIHTISVNRPIPLNVSIFRILLITFACTAVYTLLRAPSFQIPYQKRNRAQKGAVLSVTALFLLLTGFIFWLYCSPIEKPFQQESGDQVSQELVDAFLNGQVSLLNQPPEDLLKMENPYDYTARKNLNINFEWDHVLYEGKYYSYYGIAPVCLLFLPYHVLTGYYFPSYLACLIFCMIGTVFLVGAYFAMMRNWFRNTPFHVMICGLIILLMSCGIFFCIKRPMFYEMEEAAGFMFLTAGVFFIFMSGILTHRKIRLAALSVSGICMSLAVMSRPTLALYALAAVLWILYGFGQYRQANEKPPNAFRYFAASLSPYVILGGLQMLYNFLRFGSVFEFGIRYSLTISDFTKTDFFMGMAFVSLWNFLLSVPNMKSTFPFFSGNLDQWGLNGYYFAETTNTFGLFWRALPLFSYAAVPHIYRQMDRRRKIRFTLLCLLPGLILPVAIVFSTWESGNALRYNVDFAWQMLLFAFAVISIVYNGISSRRLKHVLLKILVVCTIASIITNLALLFQNIPGVTDTIFHNRSHTLLYYEIGRIFEFWY